MLSYRQLEFNLAGPAPAKSLGRDAELEVVSRHLLVAHGAALLSERVQVEWSARLRTAAGRVEYRRARVLLNPSLCMYGETEIGRTLRHELAHLLAQFRAGRRRIAPHGAEWRRACADLGIAGETRCHSLPFPVRHRVRRYLYACPRCRRDFPRTRPLHHSSACLACCRIFNRGRYDRRFRLRLVSR
jgi:predicted SprT family Zn-dependent metalloprotease